MLKGDMIHVTVVFIIKRTCEINYCRWHARN